MKKAKPELQNVYRLRGRAVELAKAAADEFQMSETGFITYVVENFALDAMRNLRIWQEAREQPGILEKLEKLLNDERNTK